MFINNEVVLASSSSSRFKILKQVGLKFKQKKPTCNEEKIKQKLIKNKKKPTDIARELASEKSLSVSVKDPNKITIGCDTIILLNNQMVQKVKTIKDAEKKLLKLSGKKHKIISAISVYKNKTKIWEHVETTVVEIRKLTKKEVKNYLYICGKEVLSSVGCYQIEGFGPIIIKKIHGDFFNVMGLPLFPLLNFIKRRNTKT